MRLRVPSFLNVFALVVSSLAMGAPVLAQQRGPTAADIKCDGCVDREDLARNSVTSEKIADGAVTSSKLAADILIDPAAVFARTVVVGPVGDGSDQAANGQALLDALAWITDADATNPYLIKLEPGIYNVGTFSGPGVPPLVMKSFIDIEGSGEGVTAIIGGALDGAVARGADDAELRALTVDNSPTGGRPGDNGSSVEIIGASTRLRQVTALGHILINGGTPSLADVTVAEQSVRSYVIRVIGGAAVDMFNVTTRLAPGSVVNVGVEVSGSSALTARQSRFSGESDLVSRDAIRVTSDSTANLVATQLAGGVAGGGTFNCVGAYDGDFQELAANCLPLP